MMLGFVYCWTDHTNGKLYVGVHKGKIDDGYICSSKPVKQMIKERPNDFTRQVLSEGDYIDMLHYEETILKSVDAKNNDAFYNKHNGDGKFTVAGKPSSKKGKPLGENHKRKMREAIQIRKDNGTYVNSMKGKKRPDLTKRNRETNYLNKGKKRSPETVEKMKQSHWAYGEDRDVVLKKKIASRKGYRHSDETKKKISEARRKINHECAV